VGGVVFHSNKPTTPPTMMSHGPCFCVLDAGLAAAKKIEKEEEWVRHRWYPRSAWTYMMSLQALAVGVCALITAACLAYSGVYQVAAWVALPSAIVVALSCAAWWYLAEVEGRRVALYLMRVLPIKRATLFKSLCRTMCIMDSDGLSASAEKELRRLFDERWDLKFSKDADLHAVIMDKQAAAVAGRSWSALLGVWALKLPNALEFWYPEGMDHAQEDLDRLLEQALQVSRVYAPANDVGLLREYVLGYLLAASAPKYASIVSHAGAGPFVACLLEDEGSSERARLLSLLRMGFAARPGLLEVMPMLAEMTKNKNREEKKQQQKQEPPMPCREATNAKEEEEEEEEEGECIDPIPVPILPSAQSAIPRPRVSSTATMRGTV
jgi:hypothetical protein